MIRRLLLITLSLTLTLITFLGIVYLAAKNSADNATRTILTNNEDYFNRSFDSWTLCVSGLSFSGYDESQSIIWNSVIAPRLIGNGRETPCEVLSNYVNTDDYLKNYTHYSRYWHGTGALFILVSSLTSFEVFKILFYLLTIFCLLFFASMWTKSEIRFAPILFLLPLLVGSNQILFQSNFAHIFPLISALIAGGILGRIDDRRQFLVLFLAGMWANFLDLLTTPLLFFGTTLFAYMVPKLEKGYLEIIKKFLIATSLWLFGFFGSWMSKWILAEILGQEGEIRVAIEQSLLRTNGKAFNDLNPSFFYPAIVNANDFLSQPFSSWLVNVGFLGLLMILITFIISRNSKILAAISLYVFLTTSLVIIWFALLRNHSLIHSWFTFRTVALIPSLIISLTYVYSSKSIRYR